MLRVSEDGKRRREGYVESYRQLGRSLLDLQQAADRIFDAISVRTVAERDKLTEISRRIQLAKVRIDAISRSKQALVISSPSQYPSSSISEDFRPLFQYKDEQADAEVPVTKLLVNGGLNREFGRDGTLELFQFFSEEITSNTLKEAQLKVGVKLTHPKESTFLEDLFGNEKSDDDCFLALNSDESDMLESEKQELPPPPPSLQLNSFSARVPLTKSEDFILTPNIKPVKNSQLGAFLNVTNQTKDAQPDIPMESNLAKIGKKKFTLPDGGVELSSD